MIPTLTLIFALLSSIGRGVHAATKVFSFDLDDSFLQGWFQGFSEVTFTMSADENVDFWVTDEDGYSEWKDNGTPATTSMFQGQYCNDCRNHNTVFNVTSSTTRYYYVVSAMFPETVPSGSLTVTFTGDGDYSTPEEEEDTYVCFAADAKLQYKNGSMLLLKYAHVNDEILAVTASGELVYSPVVSVPHPQNSKHAHFVRLYTKSDGLKKMNQVSVTLDHLLPTCRQSAVESNPCGHCAEMSQKLLEPAKLIDERTCVLQTSRGSRTLTWTAVLAVDRHSNRDGTYSIVTKAPYPVVNGIVSSPFAVNHALPHAFYNIHRGAHTLGILDYKVVSVFLETIVTLADLFMSHPSIKTLMDVIKMYAYHFNKLGEL